jgi:replicative DNA helicase
MSNLSPDSFVVQVQATERALIGSVLKDPTVIPSIGITVHSEYFSNPLNEAIWTTILDLELNDQAIDLLTVHGALQGAGKDVKPAYLAEIMDQAPVAQNLAHYAKQLIENYTVIKARALMQASLSLGPTVDIRRVISELQAIDDIRCLGEVEYMDWGEVGRKIVEKLESGETNRDGYLAQCSFPKLNEIAPLHKGELCIIGAVESGGKTAFAVNLCLGLAKMGSKGIYFFYESTAENLQFRIASITTGIPLNSIRRSELNPKQLDAIKHEMGHLGAELHYKDESQKGAIDDLMGHVKSRLKKHPCDYIVIDHMHQMPIAGKMREGFIEISRKFLALAKQENICVIALAQFRKPTERELDKRPHRGMIRESSSIAQDAHHIWFLHDPQYLIDKRAEQETPVERYKKYADSRGGQDDIPEGRKHAEIIIDKNREGLTDILPAEFRRDCVTWREFD